MNTLPRYTEQGSRFSSGQLRPPGIADTAGHDLPKGSALPGARQRLLIHITEERCKQPTGRRDRSSVVVTEQACDPVIDELTQPSFHELRVPNGRSEKNFEWIEQPTPDCQGEVSSKRLLLHVIVLSCDRHALMLLCLTPSVKYSSGQASACRGRLGKWSQVGIPGFRDRVP